MLRRVSQLLIPLAILSSVSAFAQTQDLPRVGVLDLTSENVPPAEVRLLSDRLRVVLFNTGQFTVLERQQMENILKEQGFQQSGCTATECVIEVGQLLGVEKMVAGSVGQVGAVYTISLRVINVGTGALERTAVRDCRCTIEDILTTSIAEAAAELGTYRFGRARVISTPPGAVVTSEPDGISGTTPFTAERLSSGRYRVRVYSPRRVPYEQAIEVKRGEMTTVNARLPWLPEVERARNARIKAGFRWTSLAMGVLAAGVAYKFEMDAKKAYDESDTAYESYRQATTTADAVRWQQHAKDAATRGNNAAMKRNILYGVAGGGLGVSIVLTIR